MWARAVAARAAEAVVREADDLSTYPIAGRAAFCG